MHDTQTAPATAADRRDSTAPVSGILDEQLLEAVRERVLRDESLVAGGVTRPAMRRAVARALAGEGVVVAPGRWAALVRDLVDELFGMGPVECLLRDPDVTDLMINGPSEVWIDRGPRLERTSVRFRDESHLRICVDRVLAAAGKRLDVAHPWADAVLPGGIRLHAMLPPAAERLTVTLRRLPTSVRSWDELEASGTVPAQARELLRRMVAERRTIVVCGRTGAGKTTLLARLLRDVANERVVILEDTAELAHPCPHAVHLRTIARRPDGGATVDLQALVRNALRMRPDRLVVGEVRGPEVADMLQALNTGHEGSLTTVHANSTADALVRLEGMALLAGIPLAAARRQIATAIDVIVAIDRDAEGRRLQSISEISFDGTQLRATEVWA